MADSLVEYKKLLDINIFKPFLNSMNRRDIGLVININKYMDMGLHFWQNIFIELFHMMGLSMPSIKSIEKFIENMRVRNGQITLKNTVFVYLDNGDLYLCDTKKMDNSGIQRNIKNLRDYFK